MHNGRAMLLTTALSALLATFGSSGVYGKVLIDPAKPVCSMAEPCSAPDGHDVLAFWLGGRRVATTTTRPDGSFRLALPPGLYRLARADPRAQRRLRPARPESRRRHPLTVRLVRPPRPDGPLRFRHP
jgi:hypothetical protein